MTQCQICSSSQGSVFNVREQMFGTGEEFSYFECAECGCLQLQTVPEDLSRYYPADYYSFKTGEIEPVPKNALKAWMKQERDRAVIMRQGGLFGLLAKRYPNPELEKMSRWFVPTGIRKSHQAILDIGCGGGDLLKRFSVMGFSNLTGIDPYRNSSEEKPGFKLLSLGLEDLTEETYDLIMLHHTFEHMSDPQRVLQLIEEKLSPGGCCVIRIPLKSEGSWKKYGVHWGEIDAPRHLFLHTEESLSRAARQRGLEVSETLYEDEPFAYYLSELYQRGKSMKEIQNGDRTAWENVFSEDELQQLQHLSTQNNRPGYASRAAFLLRRLKT